MTQDLILSRRLGRAENFFRSRFDADCYRNFCSVASFSKSLIEDKLLLFRALRKTVIDYHILVCNVFKDEDAGYCVIRPIESTTLGELVLFSNEGFSQQGKPVSEAFLNMLCRERLFQFYVEKPLFKLYVAGSHDLAATFEHTLSDGVVALSFFEIFLENLIYCDDSKNDAKYAQLYGAAPQCVDETTEVFNWFKDRKYVKHSLPPPVEAVMQDLSVDYTGGDPHHYTKRVPEGFPQRWPGRFPASKDFSVAFKLFNIPPDQFKKILAKCKEHKVTFTAFLVCCQAVAFLPVYGQKHHTLNLVAVTLRRFLLEQKLDEPYAALLRESNYRILGNYANMGLPELLPPTNEFSWDLVQEINGHLLQTVANDKLLNPNHKFYSTASEIGDNLSMFAGNWTADKADAIKMSNLGLAKFPVAGSDGWTIKDIVFAQDLAPAAADFVLNVISTPLGGLNIVVSYFDHKFEEGYDNFDEFPARLRKALLDNAGVQ